MRHSVAQEYGLRTDFATRCGGSGLTEREFEMLVLTRKENERIQIGNTVITVVGIRGGKVRIGIDAPDEFGISRLAPVVKPTGRKIEASNDTDNP